MREYIKEHLELRVQCELTDRSPIAILKKYSVDTYLDKVIEMLFVFTRPRDDINTFYFTEVSANIGHAVMKKLSLRTNSGLAVKIGVFILWTFEHLGITELSLASKKKHNVYIMKVMEDEIIRDLFDELPIRTIEKLPHEFPPIDYYSTYHASGLKMIKTNNQSVLKSTTPKTHPMVFDVVNKAQKVGWTVNEEVYRIAEWALANKAKAFDDIWSQKKEAKATKIREAETILSIARKFKDKVFYHQYFLDFRGRRYCNTTYFHEQSCDLSRGLLLRADAKPITKDGFFWLCISIANNWAGPCNRDDNKNSDKIPLADRFAWVIDNEEIFIDYANNPKISTGWMVADKPWAFFACCVELAKFRKNQIDSNDYSYLCHLEGFIDGSCNGIQHLAALTRDEETAVHVNLIPTEFPGDLYAYVAEFVWKELEGRVKGINNVYLEALVDEILDLKQKISESVDELRTLYINELRILKSVHDNQMDAVAALFWLRIEHIKHKRKIVKRPVMTISYGSTPFGMGDQIIADSKRHGIPLLKNLEHKWGAVMGRTIYSTCQEYLKRPMQLLSMFEKAGKEAESRGEFLSWEVPITNFKVVQEYTKGKVRKVWAAYGPPEGDKQSTNYYDNALQLNVCFVEDREPAKGKQSLGASPNIVHSLDAAHLMLTVHRANFTVTTVHDSYGCLFADMPNLYQLVRQTFVELYFSNPLEYIGEQIGLEKFEYGDLKITDILDSQYAFS